MSLFRSVFSVGAMTLLSRITGLVREVLTARLLGAGAESDAFFVAFRIPNLLRRLFAEGAFSHAFVPLLAGTCASEGKEKALVLAQKVSVLLFVVLMLVVVCGTLGASGLVALLASGYVADATQHALTVRLTQIMFPYILLISMVAMASGVLNTLRSFAWPAFAPVLLNLSFIIGAWFFSRYVDPVSIAFAYAVMLGGVFQLLFLWWGLHRHQAWLSPWAFLAGPRALWHSIQQFNNPEVRRLLANMLPAILAVSVSQISLIINTNIASHLGLGAVSWVSYADRLMEFPTALLGVALGTVLLPSLSAAAKTNTIEFSNLLDWGLRLTILIGVPSAVGLGLFSEALVSLLFHYGRFDAHDVDMTAQAVLAYSMGLLGLVLVKVLAPGFYAQQDIKTPVKIAVFVVLATQVMNVFFVPWFGHAGLSLSIAFGAILNAAVLFWGLKRKGLYVARKGWVWFCLRCVCASILMGLLLLVVNHHFDWIRMGYEPLRRVFVVVGIVLIAALTYVFCLFSMGFRLSALRKS